MNELPNIGDEGHVRHYEWWQIISKLIHFALNKWHKEQASSATRRAQDAKAAADKAAAGRAAALATLRAAPPVKNDCDAPAAHVSVKDQL